MEIYFITQKLITMGEDLTGDVFKAKKIYRETLGTFKK